MLAPPNVLRFNSQTCICGRSTDDIGDSPRKKHKTSIQSRWQAAVDKMVQEYNDDNDGLPSVGEAYSESLYGSISDINVLNVPKKVAKGSHVFEDAHERWSPPPHDPTLTIPGELVFSREPRGMLYWPARLEEYIPPTKPTQKPKYKVRFLDEEVHPVTRELFFTSEEDGFLLCKVCCRSMFAMLLELNLTCTPAGNVGELVQERFERRRRLIRRRVHAGPGACS
jgi:hypothetical protein